MSKQNELTQEQLKHILNYDCNTGIFTWRNPTTKIVKIGSIAGSLKHNGYIEIKYKGVMYQAHRLAWLYVRGTAPLDQIDHINHIRNDNRIHNLRSVCVRDNAKNRSLYRTNNKSNHNGVTYNKRDNKWHARITVNNTIYFLGSFIEIYQAIEARNRADIKYSFHCNHGCVNNKNY